MGYLHHARKSSFLNGHQKSDEARYKRAWRATYSREILTPLCTSAIHG